MINNMITAAKAREQVDNHLSSTGETAVFHSLRAVEHHAHPPIEAWLTFPDTNRFGRYASATGSLSPRHLLVGCR
jgi:hypothetical protein